MTSIVVARSLNNVIGHGQEIPWRVKGEQALFREITLGGTLVMGRKTFESIGRPLPGRETIIVTRNTEYAFEGCHTAPSLESALAKAEQLGRPVHIVGGGEIYAQALPIVDTVHLSTIQAEFDGDVFFPTFPTADFVEVEQKLFTSNIDYLYQRFERR